MNFVLDITYNFCYNMLLCYIIIWLLRQRPSFVRMLNGDTFCHSIKERPSERSLNNTLELWNYLYIKFEFLVFIAQVFSFIEHYNIILYLFSGERFAFLKHDVKHNIHEWIQLWKAYTMYIKRKLILFTLLINGQLQLTNKSVSNDQLHICLQAS